MGLSGGNVGFLTIGSTFGKAHVSMSRKASTKRKQVTPNPKPLITYKRRKTPRSSINGEDSDYYLPTVEAISSSDDDIFHFIRRNTICTKLTGNTTKRSLNDKFNACAN
ncbi:hypothetical protein PIB30_081888 [Stylosanthes scabra]|uniref:Uncharacterized protein n=1 Tax=Stylosanthes scabra TaxID=79078 RepID=A0ABU6UQN0_9FABA|nr:hypothetical protein [Stylosanthes scabra]